MTVSTQTNERKKKPLKGIYGEIPSRPVHLSHKSECINEDYAAGKAILKDEIIYMDLADKEAKIPIKSVLPKGESPCPVIIFLSDEADIPNRFLPIEEIIDRGYGIISLFVNDISENDGNFKTKICGKIARSRKRKDAAGKIAVWAWALMRALDYATDSDEIDNGKIILAGQGIYARAAMLAAAFDERVSFVIANGIGSYPPTCSERISQRGTVVRDYPYLYSPSFVNDPFGDELCDLLSGCHSRRILMGSAEDGYSNPSYEIECIYSATSESNSKICDMQKEIPTAPLRINKGNISYHLRSGTDYFSREDWNIYLDEIDKKVGKSWFFDNSCLLFT